MIEGGNPSNPPSPQICYCYATRTMKSTTTKQALKNVILSHKMSLNLCPDTPTSLLF